MQTTTSNIVAAALLLLPAILFGELPQPPSQPGSGPGGSDYPHAAVTEEIYGEGGSQFWLLKPAEPEPASAPVVIFNHGWGGMNPAPYGAWLEHLVRRGNIVIYPRYQEDLRTPTREFTPNMLEAVKTALAVLDQGPIKPDRTRVAVVGHSAGGIVAANYAVLARSEGLPPASALMCIEPGKSWNRAERIRIPLEDLGRVPAGTLLLTVAGEEDRVVRDVDAKRIYEETRRISAADKDFVTLVSDDHGDPALVAGHFAPCAPSGGEESTERGVDALDWYGTWKLFDALCDAAFFGKNRNVALGNTPRQRYMGRWSDGVPVKELKVTDNP